MKGVLPETDSEMSDKLHIHDKSPTYLTFYLQTGHRFLLSDSYNESLVRYRRMGVGRIPPEKPSRLRLKSRYAL